MKARVKATGEIGIVSQIDVLLKDDFISFSPNNVELMTNYVDKTDDYWEKLKHQYAGMAMQGIMMNEKMQYDLFKAFGKDESLDITISDFAIDIANTLVEKLKCENNG